MHIYAYTKENLHSEASLIVMDLSNTHCDSHVKMGVHNWKTGKMRTQLYQCQSSGKRRKLCQ